MKRKFTLLLFSILVVVCAQAQVISGVISPKLDTLAVSDPGNYGSLADQPTGNPIVWSKSDAHYPGRESAAAKTPWYGAFIYAAWIEDASGNLVKTLNLYISNPALEGFLKDYKAVNADYITAHTAIAPSLDDAADATSGATQFFNKNQGYVLYKDIPFSWDGKKEDDTDAADGAYKLRAEFTSRHGFGPSLAVDFAKGTAGDTQLALPAGFKSISYTVSAGNALSSPSATPAFVSFERLSATSYKVSIQADQAAPLQASTYDLSGRKLGTVFNGNVAVGAQSFIVEENNSKIQLVTVKLGNKTYSSKIIF